MEQHQRAISQYRQGDVLIEQIADLPKREKTENNLLVRGEGRNHGHYLVGEDCEIFRAKEDEQDQHGAFITQYVEARAKIAVKHLLIDTQTETAEHATIVLPPGRYRIIRQREFDPYLKSVRILHD